MLSSVLLHLNGNRQVTAAIRLGVQLAQQHKARLRGVSLIDTRDLAALTTTCEAAVHASSEYRRLHRVEEQQRTIRAELTDACLSATIDFDIRRLQGDPSELLATEARVHDLTITSCALPGSKQAAHEQSGFAPSELVDLLFRGVKPLLVVRDSLAPLNRVLLVYDGSVASGQAIRSYLNQNLFPAAECRLLAVGPSTEQATTALREMLELCRVRFPRIEAGSATGTLRAAMLPYAEKWQPDLIVFGVSRELAGWRRIFGEPAQDILRKTHCAFYATA